MFKKIVSLVLVTTQMGFATLATTAFADTQPEVQGSPELRLLETVMAVKGLGLSDQDLNNQVKLALKSYDAEAPAQGRDERLQEALVDLRVYTPAQAAAFTADQKAAETQIDKQTFNTPEEHAQALTNQLQMLMKLHPTGAEFSACAAGYTTAIAGAVATIIGLVLFFYNPTCHDGPGYSCQEYSCTGTYEYGRDCYYYQGICHDTVCDNPSNHPDRQAGTITLIAGGVAIAAGIVLAVVNQDSCDW